MVGTNDITVGIKRAARQGQGLVWKAAWQSEARRERTGGKGVPCPFRGWALLSCRAVGPMFPSHEAAVEINSLVATNSPHPTSPKASAGEAPLLLEPWFLGALTVDLCCVHHEAEGAGRGRGW